MTEPKMRYFEIRAPRPDFTGKLGTISFADGVAKVSFDDTRDEDGLALADEHGVSPGRAAVLFAQRRRGYVVIELGEDGKPLDAQADEEPTDEADGGTTGKTGGKPVTTKGAAK